jgi:hypothetical protein
MIDKQWMRGYLEDLNMILVHRRRKTGDKEKAAVAVDPKRNLTKMEQQLAKKHQETVNKQIEATLFKEFSSAQDPFWLNLILIENSKDYMVNKYNTLACIIAKLFEKWTSLPANCKFCAGYKLTEEIRTEAFLIATKRNLLVLDFVCGPYKLADVDNSFLLDFLRYKLEAKLDFKDKALLISTLQFHEYFDLEQTLLPLLLQDKLNVLEKYLSNNKAAQVKFVGYLDKMCQKEVCLSDYLYRCQNVSGVRADNLNRRYLVKLVTRLMKLYQIDASSCPNVVNQRYFKNLRYLLYRRYIEHSITYEPWQELILECLTQAYYLTDHFFEMLVEYCDIKEVCVWLDKLSIDSTSLPSYVSIFFTLNRPEPFKLTFFDTKIIIQVEDYKKRNNFELDKLKVDERDRIIVEKYYELKFAEERIKVIETERDLVAFMDEFERLVAEKGEVYAGMDTEWKPTCTMGINSEEQNKVAVIQVATLEAIYLIDMICLGDALDQRLSQMLAERFLNNRKIIKLGYGFTHDIQMVTKSLVGVHDSDHFRQSAIDLAYLVQQVSFFSKCSLIKGSNNYMQNLSSF